MPVSVTIYDVAERAGVSTATVSKTLSNTPYVSEKTRRKVLQAVAELGYRPSAVARSMAQGRTHTLGCIAPNLTDYTFASMIEGAHAEARRRNYFVLTGSAEEAADVKPLLEEMLARQVDGLLVINPHVDARSEFVRPLVEQGLKVVFLSPSRRTSSVLSVSCDNTTGGYQATRYLLGLGHHRIATIVGPGNEAWTLERLAGYRKALLQQGIAFDPDLVSRGDWTPESGYRCVHELLDGGRDFTALFAQNDKMALGAIRALRERGLDVPGDVSVVGFDDIPLARYFDPPLTTLHQPLQSFGEHAARLLIRAIGEPDRAQESLSLAAELVIRESCAPPSRPSLSRR
ncbi:MAG: LacI family transcriptional regulator [Caldilineae bacterium]|nr:MAG: LacI family transcriptional regulator [Caldilineae bacterium]